MSTVYLAIQKSVGREVALKVMSPSLASDPSFGSRFYREAKIVGQLSHPHIVSIYDVGSHKHYNFIAMDYLPGSPLQDRLEQGLDGIVAIKLVREIASALDYAHKQGYIHRDIKPDNILFRDDGSAVLCDFGIAKSLKSDIKMTRFGAVLGTPHYMSPEQAQGKTVDGRSDLYSLGVVFFEILTGQAPYSGDDAVAVAVKHMTSAIPRLPREHKAFQAIIDKMMAKKPADRFQTGQELVIAIDELSRNLSDKSTTTNTPTGSATLQVINLLKVLLATFWSAVQLSINRLMLTNLRFSSIKAELSSKQQEDLDSFIFNDDETDLPEALSDIPLIQDTVEQPVIRYRWYRLYWLLLPLCLVGLVFAYFPERKPAAIEATNPIKLAATLQQPASDKQPPELNEANDAKANPSPEAAQAAVTASTAAVEQTAKPRRPPPKPATAAISQYPLLITTEPPTARVRVLTIKPRYRDSMLLKPGAYKIAVDASGYAEQTFWLTISDSPATRHIQLTPIQQLLAPGSLTQDVIDEQHSGPSMVVLPREVPTLDNTGQQLRLDRPIAISRYEISFEQYDYFARQTGRRMPADFGWGRGQRPVVDISYYDAKAYARWLSQKTGQVYRLPTRKEWEFASRGGQQSLYWWGNQQASKLANCKRGCKSGYSKLFRTSTAPTGSYKANPFGLYDTAGNVAEWLEECEQWQQDNPDNCQAALVAGGSHKDSIQKLHADAVEPLDTQKQYRHVGLRLILEL